MRNGRSLSSILPLLLLSLSAPGERAAAQTLSDLAFMAGCWEGQAGGGTVIEEHYTTPSSNLMLGTTRYLRDGATRQFEFTRITAGRDGVVLLPFPGGTASADPFRLTTVEADRAVFEAPEHDFPKRIIYRRDADGSLVARIDGGEGSDQASEWRMDAAPCHRRE